MSRVMYGSVERSEIADRIGNYIDEQQKAHDAACERARRAENITEQHLASAAAERYEQAMDAAEDILRALGINPRHLNERG